MDVPPQPKGASLFAGKTLDKIIASVTEFFIVFALLFVPTIRQVFGNSEILNLTARFSLLMLAAMFNGFNVRVDDMHLLRGLSKNPLFLIVAMIIGAGTFLIVNFGGELFQVTALSFEQWMVVIGLAFLVIPMDLIRKFLVKKLQ